MSRLLDFARENGWAQLVPRIATGALRRLRDSLTARKLRAPGFRAGGSPRLLGLSHMRIGSNLHAGNGLWLEAVVHYRGQTLTPQLTLGDDVSLSDNVHIACANRIEIGSGMLTGSNILISDHAHGSYRGPNQSDPATLPVARPLSSAGEVRIGPNVWLGDGVAVLAGSDIGAGSIIAANSVVNGTIPPNTIAAGAPAKPVRTWNPDRHEWLLIP